MLFVRYKSYFFFFIAALLISGCSLWDNFTSYFNLYYNTTDLFETVELQIKEQKKNLFSSDELVLQGTANTQLIKVVEKCSQILQFHPESGYVDDALLMLGKAFYYQKNYQKGIRKFEELLAQPESDLILETKLWIGKTQIKLKDFENALSILEEVRLKAIEEGREDILQEAFVEEIVYRIQQEDYLLAVSLTNQLLENTDDETVKAEVNFELGKLYNLIQEPQNAITAFQKVFEYDPSYKIELETNIELGKTLRSVGEKEKALNIFDDMRDEAKFSDSYNLVDLETGITLYELDRIEEAVDKLTYVDTTYLNTPSSGIAKYKLGEIYEHNYQNFDSAGSYYQKSLTSTLPKEYIADASQKIRVFKKYQNLTSLINNTVAQLFYIENPEEYTKDSITFVQDSIVYVQDSLRVLEELNLYSEHLEGLAGFVDTLTNKDTVIVKDSVAVDSLNDSTTILDTTLIDPNKRAAELLEFRNRNLNKGNVKEGINIDSLFAENWDPERKFPQKPLKPDLSEDSLKSMLVKNQIELGNLFLTEMEMYDSAYYYYNYVLTNYPNTIHQANALYALGSYYLSIEERAKADSLFNVIYDNYKTESIVNAAANKLNKPLINLEFDPAKDLYSEAENEMIKKDFNTSLSKFYRIYREYPGSPVAPKALFASGWILENELNMNDSAAIVYDTLSVLYPQSEFTVKIRPKLTLYKQFQKAIEDSLKRIEDEKLLLLAEDSLDVQSDSLQTDEEMDRIFYPENEEKMKEVKMPDTKFPADTTRSVILNDPRRNPRRK